MANVSLAVEDVDRAFLNALEFLEPTIKDRARKTHALYRDLIPSGAYAHGEGLVQKSNIFHAGLGDQAGLTEWSQITTGRAPGTNGADDPGVDACTYSAKMLSYGFQARDYTGYETFRRTQDICLNVVKWNWQFKQQLALIFGYLADVTLSIWENYNRETYLSLAQKFILGPGTDMLAFTYDPFTATSMTIPVAAQVSTLTQKHLDYWHQYLSLQCPMAAMAADAGLPLFGLAIHPKDWDDMLHKDTALRQDFQYADPRVLIENYGKVRTFKGFTYLWDNMAPRFKVSARSATALTLERVVPYKTLPTTIGEKVMVDTEYVKAEYAIGVILLKDVFTRLVPPSGPTNPGGGTQFGAEPTYNGEFVWLNIQDRVTNPLKEKGFYFARFQAFAKPGEYVEDAIVFLYKRCPHVPLGLCTPDAAATSGAKTVTSVVAVDPDGDNSYEQVEVTLSAGLVCESLATVTVTFVDDTTATATIVSDTNAPTYTLNFASSADWIANGGGLKTVTCV